MCRIIMVGRGLPHRVPVFGAVEITRINLRLRDMVLFQRTSGTRIWCSTNYTYKSTCPRYGPISTHFHKTCDASSWLVVDCPIGYSRPVSEHVTPTGCSHLLSSRNGSRDGQSHFHFASLGSGSTAFRVHFLTSRRTRVILKRCFHP